MSVLPLRPLGLLAMLALLSAGIVLAKQPDPHHSLEILPVEQEASFRTPTMRVSSETATPLTLYRVNYRVTPGEPEAMARQYLLDHAATLRLDGSLDDIEHAATRRTPGGLHVRFRQTEQGYPVYRSDIVVSLNHANTVVFVTNGYKPRAVLADAEIALSHVDALREAHAYLGIRGKLQHEAVETIVYHNAGRTRLAHRVSIVPAEDLHGDWEVLVDAVNGELFRVENRACYHGEGGHRTATLTQGSGWVFDPDPLTHARAVYQAGGQFGDNNDTDTDSLLAHIVQRPLRDIDFRGGRYYLDGPYAKIMDFESPFFGDFSRTDSIWHFPRSASEFEAANVYYHIDASMRYINETLNFPLMPYQYSGGVQVDPHGLSGADNSHYITSTGRVAWGEGGVDDAEDADVILHELGHGLHDWLTNGGLSQVDGLSEGCGDYWANSYNRSKGFWTPSDAQYYWTFQWDGHNEFWNGRITNYGATYPNGLVGQIHTDGQIWASTLMQIWDDIGRHATDLNFLEGLAMTGSSTNQEDAAQAFIQADINNFGGVNLTAIEQRFTARGYTVTIPLALPLAPDAFNAYSDYQTPTAIELTWQDPTEYNTGDPLPPGDFTIEIERQGVLVASVPGGTGTYTDTGLQDGVTYQYEIFARVTATGTVSPVVAAGWTAGGARTPQPAAQFNLAGNEQAVSLTWENPAANVDGTPMDDFAGIRLYQNGVQVAEFTRAAADTGLADSESYVPATPGFYSYHITVIDSESPVNESDPSPTLGTPLSLPLGDDFNVAGDPNPGLWLNNGAEVNDRANNPISGGLALNLNGAPNGGDVVELKPLDLSGAGGNGVVLSYYYQPRGNGNAPEEGDSLLVYLKNDMDEWILVRAYPGSDLQPFQQEVVDLDSEAAGNGTFFHGQFQVRLRSIGGASSIPNDDWFIDDLRLEGATGLDPVMSLTPAQYALHGNYPNPFNPTTTIRYDLRHGGAVDVAIYNVVGQRVRTLVSERQEAGSYRVVWNGRADSGARVASGVYLVRMTAGSFVQTHKMMLLK